MTAEDRLWLSRLQYILAVELGPVNAQFKQVSLSYKAVVHTYIRL